MRKKPISEDEIQGKPTQSWSTEVIDGAGQKKQTSALVIEEPLSVEVNSQRVAVLMRLPGHEKELGAGFCVSEGIVDSFDDLLTVQHCGSGFSDSIDNSDDQSESRNKVSIRARPEAVHFDAQTDIVRLIRSGCGAADVAYLRDNLPTIKTELRVSTKMLLNLNMTTRQAQDLYKISGGVHAAALFDSEGGLITIQEDIGRHNAIDKVIGFCLLRNIPLKDTVLVATGRASHEMVTKSLRAGISIIASVSAATALAAQIAENHNLTLIGYLRGRGMSVYTHSRRIEADIN